VILMHQILEKIDILVGNENNILNCESIPARGVFFNDAISFLEDLSAYLFHDAEAKRYADVMAFAFWIRRANLEKEAEERKKVAKRRIGRGMVFHIAPSNIPIQFMVSVVYSLLAGNTSVVRISEKEFRQVDILCRALNDVLCKNDRLRPYITIVRYAHDKAITDYFSSICDARIIWGGDATIRKIQESPLPPRSIDLCFADRFSVSIINSDYYLSQSADVLAMDFYNDTFYVDQNACSSPRIVVWMGNSIDKAKDVFWKALSAIVEEKYDFKDISAVEKHLNMTIAASKGYSFKLIKDNNMIVRLELEGYQKGIMEYKGNCGFFFEVSVTRLEDIAALFEKKCQTITYCGDDIENMKDTIVNLGIRGVDRVVKIGHALDLSFIWDGYDMIESLSRIVE